jgi:hypothetical protein
VADLSETTAKVSRKITHTLWITTPYVNGGLTLGLVRDLVEAATAAGVKPTEQILVTRGSVLEDGVARMEILVESKEDWHG